MNVTPRGRAVQVPNSNGAFFSGASQVESAGSIPAADEVNIQVPFAPAPNMVFLIKVIIGAIHADEVTGLNEYNGYLITDENNDFKNAVLTAMTGGSPNANIAAALDTTGATFAVEIENTDLVNACEYRMFITWVAFDSTLTISP